MKPRYRPGKPAANGRAARDAMNQAKPLTANQMEDVKDDPKAMPYREPESLSIDGLRRRPKRGAR